MLNMKKRAPSTSRVEFEAKAGRADAGLDLAKATKAPPTELTPDQARQVGGGRRSGWFV